MKITDGLLIELDYVLRVADGDVVETSEEEGPLVYLHGNEEIPAKLEQALEGKEPGAKLELTLEPVEAFGEYDVEAMTTVARSEFPEDVELEEDQWIQVEVEMEGEEEASGNFDIDMRVVEVNDEAVVLDANHPLAGVTITYSVEVRTVRELSADELRERRERGPELCEHDHDED
jgi:FKBP-type peptidyl-prolyl cis-trans isomerase SlyD